MSVSFLTSGTLGNDPAELCWINRLVEVAVFQIKGLTASRV